MQKRTHLNQRGASTLGTVILLAVLGYGVFLGLQYVPQKIENMSLDSILEGVESKYRDVPTRSINEIESTIDAFLSTNDLLDLKDAFNVAHSGNSITVKASREWKLNMIYTEKVMRYEKTLVLK